MSPPVLVREVAKGGIQSINGHRRRVLIHARIDPDQIIPILATDLDEAMQRASVPAMAELNDDTAKLAWHCMRHG